MADSVNAPRPPRSAPVTPLGVPVVGMVGGGQLARMTSQAATGLGVGFRVLAGSAAESAAQVAAGTWLGDYRSLADLRGFAAGCDVITFDHEHVPDAHLVALERAGVQVRPAAAALRFTQDKLAMRERLTGLGVACPRFAPVRTRAEVEEFAGGGWPVVLKAVSGGYDGKGVWVCESPAEVAEVLSHDIRFLAEEYVPFERELAVLAARSPHRQGAVYPVVQTVQRDGICREVIAPAPGLAPGQAAQAQALALRIAEELGVTGLLAVEMFATPPACSSTSSRCARITAVTGPSRERARPSSSSTCGPSWTCRSAPRQWPSRSRLWPTCSAATTRTRTSTTGTST